MLAGAIFTQNGYPVVPPYGDIHGFPGSYGDTMLSTDAPLETSRTVHISISPLAGSTPGVGLGFIVNGSSPKNTVTVARSRCASARARINADSTVRVAWSIREVRSSRDIEANAMLVKSSMMKSTSTISMMVNARGEAF